MVVSGLDVVALGALVEASGAIGEAGLALAFGLGGCLLSEVLPVFGESLCPVGCCPGHAFLILVSILGSMFFHCGGFVKRLGRRFVLAGSGCVLCSGVLLFGLGVPRCRVWRVWGVVFR